MVGREDNKAGRRSERKEHVATLESPFRFVDSGLDNVYLVGIKYFRNEDGTLSAEIPAIEELMQLIARNIVLSSKELSGREIRFLRKRLGKSAVEFCTYLGFEVSTLSRIETGKQAISVQSQKLARLSYCLLSEDRELTNCAKDIVESFINEMKSKTPKRKILLEMKPNQGWRERKAA